MAICLGIESVGGWGCWLSDWEEGLGVEVEDGNEVENSGSKGSLSEGALEGGIIQRVSNELIRTDILK